MDKELKNAIELLKKEYEKAKKLKFVLKPIAYALYQAWKKTDDIGIRGISNELQKK